MTHALTCGCPYSSPSNYGPIIPWSSTPLESINPGIIASVLLSNSNVLRLLWRVQCQEALARQVKFSELWKEWRCHGILTSCGCWRPRCQNLGAPRATHHLVSEEFTVIYFCFVCSSFHSNDEPDYQAQWCLSISMSATLWIWSLDCWRNSGKAYSDFSNSGYPSHGTYHCAFGEYGVFRKFVVC